MKDKSFLMLAVTLSFLACGGAMATDNQKLLPFTKQDIQALDKQRATIEKYLADASSKEKFKTPVGKLGTLRALIEGKVFKADQTYELQSMGVVLGDVFVQDMGFHWIMVQDEYGKDPAIQYKDTTVILYQDIPQKVAPE